jgi:heptosyltransferase-2
MGIGRSALVCRRRAFKRNGAVMLRVAVIQTAFPGDVILSTAIFEALKAKEPQCESTAVVRPESICLLKNNPYIDKIIAYDKYGLDRGVTGVFRIASQLKGYDRAIIVQRHLRSTLISYLAHIPERVGYDISSAKFLLTKKIKYRRDRHEVERCLDLLEINDDAKRYKPKIYLDDETIGRANHFLSQNGIKTDFIAVAPGSAWNTKKYPHYFRLIDLMFQKFNMPVVLVGGLDDKVLSKSICELTSSHPLDLTGQTNLLESAAIFSRAKLVISNDSAPAHIAAAVDTPIVAIFGPTVPSFGFAPYSEKSAVVDIGTLYCRPCTTHGSRRCPERHFNCMKNLSPEKILESVKSFLA